MSCNYLPLRWESSSDQYWFASPVDWAAATGHYDLLRHLLLSDPNLFLSLTSLRRLRRLHSFWDDDPLFSSASAARSSAAHRLFLDCGPSLLSSGYGPWLLFSAAAAADFSFASTLLHRHPLLVFGEGEYGLSDLLYAAAAGRHLPTFFLLLDHALSPVLRERSSENGREREFREEVVNRAVHAAARGGNWEIMEEVLRRFAGGGGDEVLAFRDAGGAAVLHSAASRGRVEVIEGLLMAYDVMADVRDEKGNTAIHVAAFRGHAAAIVALIRSAPSSAYSTSHDGSTALHVAIAGFAAPGFRLLDRQLEVVKTLLAIDSGKLVNVPNKQGRTALHVAAAENVHADAMALLMGAPVVNVNAMDVNGLTAFDLLRRQRQRRGAASELRRLISTTGIESLKDAAARSVMAAQIRESQMLTSPGTSFRVHDSEILFLCGVGDDSAARSVDTAEEQEEIETEEL